MWDIWTEIVICKLTELCCFIRRILDICCIQNYSAFLNKTSVRCSGFLRRSRKPERKQKWQKLTWMLLCLWICTEKGRLLKGVAENRSHVDRKSLTCRRPGVQCWRSVALSLPLTVKSAVSPLNLITLGLTNLESVKEPGTWFCHFNASQIALWMNVEP